MASDKSIFCFHGVRSFMQIFGSDDPHLRVEPSWFYEWLDKAVNHYGVENMVVTFDDAYRDVMTPAVTSSNLGIRTIVFVPGYHVDSRIPGVPYDIMGSADLIFIGKMGVEIGAHGWSHRPWSELGEDLFKDEAGDSLSFVEGINSAIFSEESDMVVRSIKKIPVAPPHGDYSVFQYTWLMDRGYVEDVYGTVLYPALDSSGSPYMGIPRILSSMAGYTDEPNFKTKKWPWEE